VSPAATTEHPSAGVRFAPAARAAAVYACLVLIMWGAYNPHSGMSYETGFSYTSETGSAWSGFFYSDPVRIHTNTFYHLSYLIGEALGIRGSYVPFQVVYALLWWARGLLVFGILRWFFPASLPLCYAAGALVVIQASDGALQWVGQLNQFGFMFWMLLAMYYLLRAWQSSVTAMAAALTIAACFFEYMSLWSYESQLLLILLFPVFPALARGNWRKLPLVLAWYSVPAVYLGITVLKYLYSAGQSYQEGVMRKTWTAGAILGDWAFNVAASLEFWNWARGGWRSSPGVAYLLAGMAALVFAAWWRVAVAGSGGTSPESAPMLAKASCWRVLLAAGLVILFLSFPVYLLLSSARGLWRTQLLAGIGSGLVMTAVLGLLGTAFRSPRWRTTIMLAGGSAIVFCGTLSAVQKGGFHLWIWERYRTAMTELLRAVPGVQPDTIVVMTGVPRDDDPFGDNYWFDIAVRLAYPGVRVAGIYLYPDGTPGPGNNWIVEGPSWQWDGKGFARLFQSTPAGRTVVVEYRSSGAAKLGDSLPRSLCRGECPAALYQPAAAIVPGPASPIAIRRFRLEETQYHREDPPLRTQH
jgi:hypothetical protein